MLKKGRCKYCHESFEEHVILSCMISLGVRTQDPTICSSSPNKEHDYLTEEVYHDGTEEE